MKKTEQKKSECPWCFKDIEYIVPIFCYQIHTARIAEDTEPGFFDHGGEWAKCPFCKKYFVIQLRCTDGNRKLSEVKQVKV